MLILASALLPALTLSTQATSWTGPTQVTNTSGVHYSPQTVQDQTGNVFIFWDQHPGIYYAVTTTGMLSSCSTSCTPTQYTKNLNNYDAQPAPIVLKNGTLIMFFSSKRGNNFDIYYSRYNAGTWSPETRLTTSPAPDQSPGATQDSAGKLWVTWTRSETGDINVKFVDSNGNGVWDPGEAIVYDSNSNSVYDPATDIVISGTALAGTLLKIDPRIGFVDSNGNNHWDPGEFVVYDSNANSIYDPKVMYVDSNNNNIWNSGETIVYKANSTLPGFTGSGMCTGVNPPATDCVIIGSVPPPQTILKSDGRLKFVDLNGDGLWEPGETLVYDTNNNGVYDNGEQAIPALSSDPKLKYIGSGATWAPGYTTIYDTNGNGVYDGKVKFVDTNGNGHWDPGETVVYDSNLDGYYTLADTPIFETNPGADLDRPLKNDPALRFVDSNANSIWDQGEAVVYDYNLNSIYDGKLKFVDTIRNSVWDSGEPVVYDTDTSGPGVGVYNYGKYHNDTLVAGTKPANNTALNIDPNIKFYDANGNTVWDPGETVVYDKNNNNRYDAETTIAFPTPNPGTPLKADMNITFAGLGSTWTAPNPVVYDQNGNGRYDTGEPVIYGTAPANQTLLKFDPKVKFVNATTNPSEKWAAGKSVIYDSNGNSVYDAETVIAGTAPAPGRGITTGLGEAIVAYGSPAILATLNTDTNVKFLDFNNNNVWDPGEPIIYDSNNNNIYDPSDAIIAGTTPTLATDPKIKFVDSNHNGIWDAGEPVAYDTNGDNKYTTGRYYNDTLIAGTTPANNTALVRDLKIKYLEANGDTTWESGETIVYDSNNNNLYDTGEPMIVGPTPTLKIDPKIKFVDSNGNGVWDSAEAVTYDANNDGLFNVGEYVIRGIIPQSGSGLTISLGEPWISGPAPVPCASTCLKSDPNIKFVDLNGNQVWDQGEPVAYDTNGNGVYDTGIDVIISGNPVPSVGTILLTDEMTLAGTFAPVGARYTSPTDTKIRFVDTNSNGHWDPGETLVYDNANNNKYTAGKYFNDTIIWGAAPANNTALTSDLLLKYFDSNSNNKWDLGEQVFRDTDNDADTVYDTSDTIITTVQTPSTGAKLVADAKIKYFETGTDTNWDPGESVVYDSNNNGIYDAQEPVIYGAVPNPGTILTADGHLKIVDSTGNNLWDPGETVVYDTIPPPNGNGVYDSGEQVLGGSLPAPGQPLRYVTHIFYKTLNGGSWSAEQRLTTQPSNDDNSAITQTFDGRLWIAWSGERTGGAKKQILERTTTDGVNWAPEVQITSVTTYGDSDPAITQDRNGTIWFAWTRYVPCSCGQGQVFEADLFTTSSINNGATWAPASALTSTTNQDEIQPSFSQLSDKKLYIFYTSLACSGSTCTVNLYYFSTQILIHAARMNSFTTNATYSVTYGLNFRAGQAIRLTANITNTGDYTDTMQFFVKANSTLVPTNSSSVTSGSIRLIIINWMTMGLRPGHYVLTANVTIAGEGQANLFDNSGAPLTVLVRPTGDVNGDCKDNILDVIIVNATFGKSAGMPGYNPLADLNNDGTVNILDVNLVGGTFGQTC